MICTAEKVRNQYIKKDLFVIKYRKTIIKTMYSVMIKSSI